MNASWTATLLVGGWLAACAAALAAEAPADDDLAARAEPAPSLRKLIDGAVGDVQIFADAESDKAARAVVALRWANNARGSEDGMTVLYVHDGRPLAVACLYPWDGKLVREFSVLSLDRIVARRDGALIWQPQEPGLKFADIPEAPEPEPKAAPRLRQMKSLASHFQSTMLGWRTDNTDREELRLLPRPLYRYEPAAGRIFDGAVFAFVMGTDPESLLLIEAVNEGDAKRWQYAFVRRTSGELEGRHRGQIVWRAERFPQTRNAHKPNFSVVTLLPPEVLPENKDR